MKKEFTKNYIVWDKHAHTISLKNRYPLITFAYIFLDVKELADVILFKEPFYRQQLFKNLHIRIKISDLTYKIQGMSEIAHIYFVS